MKPAHLEPTTDPNHDAVCRECGNSITVGETGTEYGHERATGRPAHSDCPHRPDGVDPRGPQSRNYRDRGGGSA